MVRTNPDRRTSGRTEGRTNARTHACKHRYRNAIESTKSRSMQAGSKKIILQPQFEISLINMLYLYLNMIQIKTEVFKNYIDLR